MHSKNPFMGLEQLKFEKCHVKDSGYEIRSNNSLLTLYLPARMFEPLTIYFIFSSNKNQGRSDCSFINFFERTTQKPSPDFRVPEDELLEVYSTNQNHPTI